VATAVALLIAMSAPVRAGAPRTPPHRVDRLDARLRAALDANTSEPERVIIRVRPGSRPTLRDRLVAHGDQILGEHESLDTLTAIVHHEDLTVLADNDAVLSVSADAIVRPHGLLGGVLGVVGGLLNVIVGLVELPNGADTSGPVVAPAVLRQTLG